MITDGVAETAGFENSVRQFVLIVGVNHIERVGQGDGHGLRGRSAAEGVLVGSTLELGCLVLVDGAGVEVVDAGQFVSRVEETRQLHGDLVSGLEIAGLLTACGDSLDMHGFAHEHLILAYSGCVGQLNNLASETNLHSVFAGLAVIADTLCSEAVVSGCIRTDGRISHFDGLHVGRVEGVGGEGGGVGEIEHVEVGVISRSRQFVLGGVGLVDGHTQFDSR